MKKALCVQLKNKIERLSTKELIKVRALKVAAQNTMSSIVIHLVAMRAKIIIKTLKV